MIVIQCSKHTYDCRLPNAENLWCYVDQPIIHVLSTLHSVLNGLRLERQFTLVRSFLLKNPKYVTQF